MSTVNNPFPYFPDAGTNGYIYIGAVNQNAQTNPIVAYRDAAMTAPWSQPIRTVDGYPAYQGAKAGIFLAVSEFSITVKDSNSVTVLNDTAAQRFLNYDDLTDATSIIVTARDEAVQAAADAAVSANEADQSLSGVTAATAFVTGYYPGARSYVPQGAVTGAATVSGAGTGGTNGTFALAWTGGNFAVNPTGTFTVAGGIVTSITITGPGIYVGNALSKPTMVFSASSGLSGASGSFNTVYLKTAGQYYLTDHATDAGKVSLYQNQANAAVQIAASFDPFSVGAATNAVGAVLQLVELQLQPDAGLVEGAWYANFFVPTDTDYTKVRFWIYLGTGTADVLVNVLRPDGTYVNALGPFSATTTSDNDVVSLSVLAGSAVAVQLDNITGTPTGFAFQMEGLPA